ncbi:MAG: hypothetical protein R2784_08125 [Saprospiraceae bacterium]
MEELAAQMNSIDPTANWQNDYGTFTLTGGDPQGTYGDLEITYGGNKSSYK